MATGFRARTDEILVNRFTRNDQLDPNIDANPATGGFQVVWASDGQDGDGWGVYGRNFGRDGRADGGEILINTVTDGDQTSPDVAFNEDGNGAWVWETTAIWFNTIDRVDTPISGGVADNIRTRSETFGFDSEDGFYYNEERVRYGQFDPDQEGQAGLDPRVISLGGDQFATGYLVQELFRGSSGYTVDEFTAYITPEIPRNGQWSRNFAEDERFPRGQTTYGDLDQLDEENIVVVSTMSSDFEGTDGIIQFQFFERVDADGRGLAFGLSDRFELDGSGLAGPAAFPRVAVLDDGGFAITWQEQDRSSADEADWQWDVFVQIFNADGSARSPIVAVHDASNADQITPEIAATQDGGFVITFSDGNGRDVVLQRFDADGVRLGEGLVVNETTRGYQGDSAVTVLNNGNVVVTWESDRGDGDESGVFVRTLALTGVGNKTAQHIVGTSENERFSTGARNDFVDGGGGNDVIRGGGQNDRLFGSSGRDRLFGDNGRDLLDGGDGNDNLTGGGKNDRLFGGDGRDNLLGGAGRDFLDGGDGNDILRGNGGADTFAFGAGRDVIVDFRAGTDELQFDRDLGSGGRLNKRMLERLSEATDEGLLFDFGGDELLLRNIRNFDAISDDISFA